MLISNLGEISFDKYDFINSEPKMLDEIELHIEHDDIELFDSYKRGKILIRDNDLRLEYLHLKELFPDLDWDTFKNNQ
jgi:hypothetical protein